MVMTILGVVRTGHHLEHTNGARDRLLPSIYREKTLVGKKPKYILLASLTRSAFA